MSILDQAGSGPNWTDIAQGIAAVAALIVALGLGIAQFTIAHRDRRRRVSAYLYGAVAAVEHAEVAMDEADRAFGRWQDVPRVQILMSPAIQYLRAAEAGLAAFPLHEAPSEETARALLSALRPIRRIEGNLVAFLSSEHDIMRAKYDDDVLEIEKAAIALRAEARRLLGSRLQRR